MKTTKYFLLVITVILINNFIGTSQIRPDCVIGEINTDLTECEEGFFYVYVSFEYANTSNTFKVVGNGNNYGTFEYADLPVMIGPLEGDGVTVYEFVVIDMEFGDCSNWTAIDPVNCGGGGDCFIGEINTDLSECEEGLFYVYLNFEHANTSNGFTVTGNGNEYGAFEYEDLPVMIGPLEGDGVTVYEFVVHDLEFEGCHNWTAIDPVDCNGGGGDCYIGDPFAVIQFPCEDGYFHVKLNFEYENVSDEGFKVFGNGQNYGVFGYEELPVTVGPFQGNGYSTYELGVRDLVYEGCQNWTHVCAVDCGGEECFIGDLIIDDHPCEGDSFYVYLNFNYENVGSQGFKVHGNGQFYGNFWYEELPINVGPFYGNGSTVYELVVHDLEFGDCGNWADFGPVNCGETGMDKISRIPDFELFPNPAGDAVYIRFAEQPQSNIFIRLYDMKGQKYGQIITSKHTLEKIDLRNISKGIYLIELSDLNHNNVREKIVVR